MYTIKTNYDLNIEYSQNISMRKQIIIFAPSCAGNDVGSRICMSWQASQIIHAVVNCFNIINICRPRYPKLDRVQYHSSASIVVNTPSIFAQLHVSDALQYHCARVYAVSTFSWEQLKQILWWFFKNTKIWIVTV